MVESPRISWIIAFDADPQPLSFTKLQIAECTVLPSEIVVMKVRFQKKTRSNPIVEELLRLTDVAWIERRPASDPQSEFRCVQLSDGTMLEFERVCRKKKKEVVVVECDEEDETNEELTPLTSEEKINAILCCVHDIQDRVRRIERQLKRKSPEALQPPEIAIINPPQPIRREPISVSFLRKATVTELYFKGVWIPEFDADTTFENPPQRERRFRSELQDYVEGYDIDDESFGDTDQLFKNKAVALSRNSYEHFVDRRPARSAVSLSALRREPFDVLCCLGVIVPNYDIDDERPVAMANRDRQLRTDICRRIGLPQDWDPTGYDSHFIKGHDIDDVRGMERAREINEAVLAWKQGL